jgi:hypothetical protein
MEIQEQAATAAQDCVSFVIQRLFQLLHILQEAQHTQSLVATDIISGQLLEQLYSKEREWLILHN